MGNIIKRLTPSFRVKDIEIKKSISGNRYYKIINLGFYPPCPPEATPDKGFSEGSYKTQAPVMAVNHPTIADSISNRPPLSQDITKPMADRADKVDKSDNILNAPDMVIF